MANDEIRSWRDDGRLRPSEQISLAELATQALTGLRLRRRFNAFGNDLNAEVPADAAQQLAQVEAGRGAVNATDEASVQLDEVGRRLRQFQQPGLAGPEVVKGQADVQVAQLLLEPAHGREAGHRVLVDFQ